MGPVVHPFSSTVFVCFVFQRRRTIEMDGSRPTSEDRNFGRRTDGSHSLRRPFFFLVHSRSRSTTTEQPTNHDNHGIALSSSSCASPQSNIETALQAPPGVVVGVSKKDTMVFPFFGVRLVGVRLVVVDDQSSCCTSSFGSNDSTYMALSSATAAASTASSIHGRTS